MQLKPLTPLHGSSAATTAPLPKAAAAAGQNGDFAQLLKTAQAEPAKADAPARG